MQETDSVLVSLEAQLQRLEKWFDENGYAGWDPYDISGTKFYLNLLKDRPNIYKKIFRLCFSISADIFPLFIRKILKVETQVNAKAMGLLLTSYTNLFVATKNTLYIDKAINVAHWLIAHRTNGYNGFSWGYPFDWQSVILIPQNTPSSVVTAVVGDGFYSLYKITQDEQYINICKAICSFFVNSLHRSVDEEGKVCFSYTPIDDYQVHNANLFVGEFLARVGREVNNENWVELGIKCGNFALSEQQDEGYLPYWSLAQTETHSGNIIRTDHYHSGFEIRMLYGLWVTTGLEQFRQAYQKYYEWYLSNMFTEGGLVKLTPTRYYPVNIHAIAESILCQATLLDCYPERLYSIKSIIKWAEQNMEYKGGRYVYMIKKYPAFGEWKIKIPMIRWGQSWMLRALSQALVASKHLG